MAAQIEPFTVPTTDVDTAFDRYEAIRVRLPQAHFAADSRRVRDLGAIADSFDVFILDAFGVLNVGDRAIPGAVERIAALRAAGKRLFVLTNAASYPRSVALAKYRSFGFDFTPEEVVSSRDVTSSALANLADGGLWAAASGPAPDLSDLTGRIENLEEDPSLFERADGFLLLSSANWTADRQSALVTALTDHPRPLLVGNPDLVAPRENGLTLEPGWWAHAIADRTTVVPEFFGKPYANAFAAIERRCPEVKSLRVAMVGDTLHTDILGGRAAGFTAILITDHGLFAGRAAETYVARSGIVPDIVCRTT
ncbi:HAD-IIA family hydrolase [Algihabitans albus]|uniref:HAD-IIA family hydrolase n=1 Tax=Algihabitans albus TaxID=2164067 RepID=UPI000E5DA58B|nr:HAD-IIA family hydrolase [Algihabitans albus]